jgi:hypothetical protein
LEYDKQFRYVYCFESLILIKLFSVCYLTFKKDEKLPQYILSRREYTENIFVYYEI